MPFVDRTNDFFTLVATIKTTTTRHNTAVAQTTLPRPGHDSFTVDAAECRTVIARAERGLDRMRRLGHQSGVFDEPGVEMGELTTIIQMDLDTISQTIQRLGAMRQTEHTAGILASLKSSAMMLAQEFAATSHTQLQRMRATESHRRAFGANHSGNWSASAGLRARGPRKAGLNQMDVSLSALDEPEAEDDACVINLPSSSMLAQQQRQPRHNVAAVEAAEKMIGEVAKSFQKMTGILSQQKEMLASIDHNLDMSVSDLDKAQTSLSAFLDGITGNRALVLKVFGVLILFTLFAFYFLSS